MSIYRTKPNLAILVFILMLFLVGVILFFTRATVVQNTIEEDIVKETPKTEAVVQNKFCYSREQIATPVEPYAVSEYIELYFDVDKVSGVKSGTQNGPELTNGYFGTLLGEKQGDVLRLVYSYTVEGAKNKELEIYEFSKEILVKKRYVLKEGKGILIPDESSALKNINYLETLCR